jgi:transposase-like protein
MDCPICGYDVDTNNHKIEAESGVWKTAYKCPNCQRKFQKKTLLNKGTGYVARTSVWLALATLVGHDWDGDGHGEDGCGDDEYEELFD